MENLEKSPYEGAINKEAIEQKRDEYIEQAIEEVFANKAYIKSLVKKTEIMPPAERDDFLLSNLKNDVFIKIVRGHDLFTVDVSEDEEKETTAEEEEMIKNKNTKKYSEISREYPEEAIIRKIKEKIGEKGIFEAMKEM